MSSRRFRTHASVLAAFAIAGVALLAPVEERRAADEEPLAGGVLEAAFAKALPDDSVERVMGGAARVGFPPSPTGCGTPLRRVAETGHKYASERSGACGTLP